MIRKAIGWMALASLPLLFGACSGTNQTQQQCLAIETIACAGEHDPATDRPGFGACVANEAQLCGVVPTPAPSPAAK